MIREEATEQILEAKKQKGLTFEAIAQKVGRHKVWTTAALLGQHPMSAEEADAVGDLLDLDPEVTEALQEIPLRGSLGNSLALFEVWKNRTSRVRFVYGGRVLPTFVRPAPTVPRILFLAMPPVVAASAAQHKTE
jgi:cyanate lyase